MPRKLLILETSQRLGQVALADNDVIVLERSLDESRRHARDLVPAIQHLLTQFGWRAHDLEGVIVSRGPGSYTGLRVGIMSAKTLAYAIGCPLIAINTFEAIADHAVGFATPAAANLDVIDDAQQGKIYAQRFGLHPEPLMILPMAMWLESALAWNVAVAGPGLDKFGPTLPAALRQLSSELWRPRPESLLRLGLARMLRGERDDPFAVEPLYLRASSAEEKWEKLHPGG
ncbi:MAG: tRNA (adenosine(37)-N6)-threonylcarbamoyltransferase complex dimerization subunit type 1 TsaB [Planctomycetes bacterium]|nr:tRNA (adenosine(37)-N6)-threonylcarbamoyltransferase complex dimerization subunit type 1 TsaB [Planctomycetota bacterium]